MSENTKYMMVKNRIKEWIVEGKVMPGEKIHSENQLVDMFQVSRHTVRQAIGELVHEGWLYRERGAGTFCAHRTEQVKSKVASRKSIGVITTYLSDYIFPSIIRGVESYLTENGYSMVVASTNNNIETERQCLEMMLEREVDGLIVEPTKSHDFNPNLNYYLTFEQKKIPYIMINQFYQELQPPHIIVNDENGGYLATNHLLGLGHTKIAGLFKIDDLQGMKRMKGFIRAFREKGLSFAPQMMLTYTTENRQEIIGDKMKALLSQEERPTAIVCYNDEVAMSVLQCIRDLRLKVPEDISIVSHDDSYLSEASEVKLTSVTHPKMQMGVDAAEWIIGKIENQGKHLDEIIYEPEIVIRTSTRKLGSKQI